MPKGPNAGGAGKILHTYASDLAETMKESGSRGAFVKEAITESREREKIAEEKFPYSPKNIAFTIGGIVLLIAGIIGIVLSFRKPVSPPPPPTILPIIISDNKIILPIIDFDREKVIAALIKEKGKQLGSGAIEAFTLTKNGGLINKRDFFSLFAPNAPRLAAFTSDYLLGQYGDTPNKFFILLKTDQSYDFRLALQSWEEKMTDDLYPLFGITPTLPLLQLRFTDDFILNHPARVVKTNEELVLGYLYLDDGTIAVANDLAVFTELDQRFFQQKIRK